MTTQLEALQREIGGWAEATFPLQTPQTIIRHLKRELVELQTASGMHAVYDGDHVSEELADIAILILAYAHRAGLSLELAITQKMTKNRERQWHPPDIEGVVEHVAETTTLFCNFEDCPHSVTTDRSEGEGRRLALEQKGWIRGPRTERWYCPMHGSDAALHFSGEIDYIPTF